MRFEGNGRIITIVDDKVIITASNSLIGRLDAKNFKGIEIKLTDITNIDCKDASLFSNGFIKLYVNGKASLQTTIPFLPRGGIYQQALNFARTLSTMIQEQKKFSGQKMERNSPFN